MSGSRQKSSFSRIDLKDRRPAWEVRYPFDAYEIYYVDALSGALIAKGSNKNKSQ